MPCEMPACVPVRSSQSKGLADSVTSGFSTREGSDSGPSPLVSVRSRRSSQKNSARTNTSTAVTEDAGAKLRALGGADAILATAPSGKAMSGLVNGLAVRGKLLVIGLAPDPLEVSSGSLVFGMHSISGSTTGSVQDEQETVRVFFARKCGADDRSHASIQGRAKPMTG